MGQPWMFRRVHHGDFAASGLTVPPNVVRMPRGPDKGRGFQKWCKNRMETSNGSPSERTRKPERPHAVPIVAPPKEEEKAEEVVEAVAQRQEESPEEDQVVPDGAAALPEAEAANNADAVVPEAAAAGAAAAADSCSDSGHEDGGLSEHEIDLGDNERSR